MSSVLMTSTMKSEPGTPPMRGRSFGVPVSVTATCMVGGSADGERGAGAFRLDLAALAGDDAAVVAAPATATPARNLRRLTSGRAAFLAGCLCVMRFSFVIARGDH